MKFYNILTISTLLTLNAIGVNALYSMNDECRNELAKLELQARAAFNDMKDEAKQEEATGDFLSLISRAVNYEKTEPALNVLKDYAIALWRMKHPNRSKIMQHFLYFDNKFILNHVQSYLMNCGKDRQGGEILKELLLELLDMNVEGAKKFVLETFDFGPNFFRDIAVTPHNPEWVHRIEILTWIASWLYYQENNDDILRTIPEQYYKARDLYFPRDYEEKEYNNLNRELCFVNDETIRKSYKENRIDKYHKILISERPICWQGTILGIAHQHPLKNHLIAYTEVLKKIFFSKKGHQIWEQAAIEK